jgi:HEAT repeat protein
LQDLISAPDLVLQDQNQDQDQDSAWRGSRRVDPTRIPRYTAVRSFPLHCRIGGIGVGLMSPLFLGLGLLLAADRADSAAPPASDLAQLEEMLLDRQNPRQQNQAALLLLQDRSPEAETLIREALLQTDAAEVFQALVGAVRLTRDQRFADELLAALTNGRAGIRQAAAETLAIVATPAVLTQLDRLIAADSGDRGVQQASIWVLGRQGSRQAAGMLIEQIEHADPLVRRDVIDALIDLTGRDYGGDADRWRIWWQGRQHLTAEQWLQERLSFHASRTKRLEGNLERTRSQMLQLQQQLYARLPAADRLGHVQNVAEHEDPAIRALAVTWSIELLPVTDATGQRALADLLLRLGHDGNAAVQKGAIAALGRISDPRIFEELRQLLTNRHVSARAAAARALAQHVTLKPPAPAGLGTEMMCQAVPLLQMALNDPALDVVVAAAEGLGGLGVPEAGPVLTALLQHPSESVRQTAAQALERVADASVLEGLLAGLEDPAVTVRFGLVGAIGRAASEGLSDEQRTSALNRLEEAMLRDADPGVRSRCATVMGQFAPPSQLGFLWRRIQSHEDGRVQEKSWSAMLDILTRAASLDLLKQWDRILNEANQGGRRVEMHTEIISRWRKLEDGKDLITPANELLAAAQLDHGKWSTALPLARDLLDRPGSDADLERRLRLILSIARRAYFEDNHAEALRIVQDAKPYLSRAKSLTAEFDRLEKQARSP